MSFLLHKQNIDHFSDIAFGCDMRLAARDMCARRLFYLIKLTDSSAIINFALCSLRARKILRPFLSALLDGGIPAAAIDSFRLTF